MAEKQELENANFKADNSKQTRSRMLLVIPDTEMALVMSL